MNAKSYSKYCIVPCCKNTTSTATQKLFFSVPRDPVKRKAWTQAMKRDEKLNTELSSSSPLWCCEDHFTVSKYCFIYVLLLLLMVFIE